MIEHKAWIFLSGKGSLAKSNGPRLICGRKWQVREGGGAVGRR